MEFSLEEEIYCEILQAFELKQFNSGFEEREIIKLMRMLQDSSLNQEIINIVVKNAIILLLTLFFRKNSLELSGSSASSENIEKNTKKLFLNMLNGEIITVHP
ncbi:MAG: hypothetical protein DRO88_04105 [Promethearchaeia archaeon]|nr:MAG: hypothetical protein DRO88_04105 [Candidatus Lokiarchaeia archaeon]